MPSGAVIKYAHVIKFLDDMDAAAKMGATIAVGLMAASAFDACQQLLSIGDHDQPALNRLKNPYASKYGSSGLNLHDPNVAIHTQSGDYLSGLRKTAPIANASGATAYVLNDDPKDEWLQIGTEVMIARPYMDYVVTTYGDDIKEIGRNSWTTYLDAAAKR